MLLYEKSLDQNWELALSEGSQFFEGKGAVQAALRKITQRLKELEIPYAVVGGMALFSHGFRRFTEDVDILVKPDDLKKIHQALEGRGYLLPFPGSKNLRDTEFGVQIAFWVSGQFPGDGKPKPVAFPDPSSVASEQNEIYYLNLIPLIELKLASGISSAERIKDLADVQELIKLLSLPENLAGQLSVYVQEKYRELWRSVNASPKRYLTLWRSPYRPLENASLEEMIHQLREAADLLEAMKQDGVQLDPRSGLQEGIYLFTTDPEIAAKYEMHDEAEFWDFSGEEQEKRPE